MIDERLEALLEAAGGPFPPECNLMEMDGEPLPLVDYDVHAVASWYRRNLNPLSDEHREMLTETVAFVDRILQDLPTDRARSYFARARDVGKYLLETRTPRPD